MKRYNSISKERKKKKKKERKEESERKKERKAVLQFKPSHEKEIKIIVVLKAVRMFSRHKSHATKQRKVSSFDCSFLSTVSRAVYSGSMPPSIARSFYSFVPSLHHSVPLTHQFTCRYMIIQHSAFLTRELTCSYVIIRHSASLTHEFTRSYMIIRHNLALQHMNLQATT